MIKSVRGFKDILPEETPAWSWLEAQAREILVRYGFREIRVPILEKTELFARSIGEATDIVEKEMYTFVDRNQERLTLRPEATAGIVRAFIEHGLHNRPKPIKLFTIGPMFRHERPQKGRLRQFHQIDVEVFGAQSPGTDAELVVMALDILEAGGARNLRLEINSLGCPDCRVPFREELREFLLARKERLCEDCQRRAERNPLRALDCKNEVCQAEYREAPELTNFLCEDCRAHYEAFKAYLSEAEVSYQVNPRLVRGLDYYTRTIFEIKAPGLGAQDTVAAGGRYDGLVSALGGPDTPAVGFAIGIERWLLVSELPAELESPPELFIAPLGEEAARVTLRLARSLRARGIRVEADYEGRRLKALLRQADRLSARKVLILGEDELQKKEALLKDLETRTQEPLPFENLTDLVNRILIDLRF
ncbi:histidine--tRNA ligase [Thermosulfurimonas dismutans]|uniref:Histidine--tRNA ligase n=1 Tax=Thermosulfurimonas dismutans TaxID=999894 RepID=A0A179D313_9BACT|nr:histidine--tRNA ligase [Thermosulfurimonas dismutans]OAQ20436.1 Histidyl-tRNA synthetase [Thermosulfurimonas dismutans]